MVADILHHVNSNGIVEIHKSELFTRDDEVTYKDKEFIDTILSKRCIDINTKEMKKLKDIVRLHMPSNSRVPLWMFMSGGIEELSTTTKVYDDTCERLFSDGKIVIIVDTHSDVYLYVISSYLLQRKQSLINFYLHLCTMFYTSTKR